MMGVEDANLDQMTGNPPSEVTTTWKEGDGGPPTSRVFTVQGIANVGRDLAAKIPPYIRRLTPGAATSPLFLTGDLAQNQKFEVVFASYSEVKDLIAYFKRVRINYLWVLHRLGLSSLPERFRKEAGNFEEITLDVVHGLFYSCTERFVTYLRTFFSHPEFTPQHKDISELAFMALTEVRQYRHDPDRKLQLSVEQILSELDKMAHTIARDKMTLPEKAFPGYSNDLFQCLEGGFYVQNQLAQRRVSTRADVNAQGVLNPTTVINFDTSPNKLVLPRAPDPRAPVPRSPAPRSPAPHAHLGGESGVNSASVPEIISTAEILEKLREMSIPLEVLLEEIGFTSLSDQFPQYKLTDDEKNALFFRILIEVLFHVIQQLEGSSLSGIPKDILDPHPILGDHFIATFSKEKIRTISSGQDDTLEKAYLYLSYVSTHYATILSGCRRDGLRMLFRQMYTGELMRKLR